MFTTFFNFEIKYRLRSISTYVYFALWFFVAFFCVASEDFGPIGTGKIALNGPYAISDVYMLLTAYGSVVISALFGTSILRDFKEDTYQLIFTRPVKKFAYLGGRWAGSMVITTLVFLGLPLGMAVGGFMPWVDHSRILPLQPAWLIQPFVAIVLVQIFFLGSVFFTVAALTRRLMIVYLQGVVVFAAYLMGAVYALNSKRLDPFWPSVLDPMGIVVVRNVTRYWTVAEKNSQLLQWSGMFLYNRLLWAGVGIVALVAGIALFPMSAEALASGLRSRGRGRIVPQEDETPQVATVMRVPRVPGIFGGATTFTQLLSLTRLRFWNIAREVPFWAITVIMIVLCVVNGRQVGRFDDTAVWPVTYLMVGVLQGSATLFLIVIATLYAGELIWRERDVKFEQIHDALPMPGWVTFMSQFFALGAVQFVLMTVVLLCGIGVQISLGYYRFELLHYFKDLYLIAWPNMLVFCLIALFFQTMVPNKFAGHGLVIGVNVLAIILSQYNYENRLYQVGSVAPYTYSDMNGYGHFVPAIFWSSLYWCAFAAMLGVVSIAFARRGADLDWSKRWKAARERWGVLQPAFLVFLLVFAGSGAWYYYNAHVLNEYRTAKDDRHIQAAYEKNFKQYEKLPMPKVTAVDVNVDISPETRSFSASGHYLLTNHGAQAIPEIHVSGTRQSVDEVRFDRPSKVKMANKRLGYWIYKLDQPLQPGETLRMDFRASHASHGFRDGHELDELAYNGTFFDRDFFPIIGYTRNVEIDDPVRRREEGLPELVELSPPGDPYWSNFNLFTPDSDWITFHTVVSTSPDQIAIAPGYLKREWKENNVYGSDRRYFEYDMGDVRVNDFFSFLSGNYHVRRDRYKGVNLEIYYQPGHEYNLDRMLQASKKGLDYFGKNFAPFQFRQYRIIEFPRYRNFAQSFPNTVPYSESLGFIQRVQKPDDIDEIFYVTAHELAHQWWGHQLIGSMTAGANMMSETLAQYSALMIMEKEYGLAGERRFLKHELDQYLRGRSGERRREWPLALVQNEPYVWYRKGSVIMYGLRDYLGEDRLNAALSKFLMEHRYATGPYPDSVQFVNAMRDAAPPELKQLVTDSFDSIVLFDNKVTTANWTKMPDGKYRVRLTLESRKLKADGLGAETEMPSDDWIDVGVFGKDENDKTPLFFEKRKFTGGQVVVDVEVDRQPARAGIDPYHKLIDRKPDDNTMAVGRS